MQRLNRLGKYLPPTVTWTIKENVYHYGTPFGVKQTRQKLRRGSMQFRWQRRWLFLWPISYKLQWNGSKWKNTSGGEIDNATQRQRVNKVCTRNHVGWYWRHWNALGETYQFRPSTSRKDYTQSNKDSKYRLKCKTRVALTEPTENARFKRS